MPEERQIELEKKGSVSKATIQRETQTHRGQTGPKRGHSHFKGKGRQRGRSGKKAESMIPPDEHRKCLDQTRRRHRGSGN